MSRLSPLIVRRVGPRAAILQRDENQPFPLAFPLAEASRWLDDLRLFATGWVGGLIFFGTLIG